MDSDKETTPLLKKSGENGSLNLSDWLKNLTIEPVVFLHSFGWSLSDVMLTNQIMYQTCVYELGPDQDICSQLESATNETAKDILEQRIQPYASSVSMAIYLLTSVVSALVALFFGPWSDKFGRKPVVVAASVGYLLTDILISWICYMSSYFTVSPWWYVLANVPIAALGGFTVFNAGVFSFMNDITDETNRTIRMGILEGFTMFGVLAGLLTSSYWSNYASVTVVFSISSAATIFSIIYLLLFIRESIPVDEAYQWKDQLKALFNIDLLLEMVDTFSKPRPYRERTIVWLLIAVGGCVEFAFAGRTLFFLYTRRRFGWDVESYCLWLSAELGLITIGTLFGIALLKKLFNVSDLGLVAISTISQVVDYLIKGSAQQSWQLYFTIFMGPFKGIESSAVRSMLATILPSDDVGKSYAMDLSVKAVTPILSVFLFTFIYNHTVNSLPSMYLFVISAIFASNLILIGGIYYLLKKRQKESQADLQMKDTKEVDYLNNWIHLSEN